MTINNLCNVPEVHGERCRCRLKSPDRRDFSTPPSGREILRRHPVVADMVNHPPHYTSHPSGVECIDITRHLSFCVGNGFKYVFRALGKGNAEQDYDKARFYLFDALRHADPIFLPSFTFRTSQLLNRVVEAETEHNRLRFFRAIAPGNIAEAHAAAIALRDAA